MATVKNGDINLVDILSDLAVILDAAMIIRLNHADHILGNKIVEFAQGLASRAAQVGGAQE